MTLITFLFAIFLSNREQYDIQPEIILEKQPNDNGLINSNGKVLDQLTQIVDLKEKGVLTEEMFNIQKEHLIKKLETKESQPDTKLIAGIVVNSDDTNNKNYKSIEKLPAKFVQEGKSYAWAYASLIILVGIVTFVYLNNREKAIPKKTVNISANEVEEGNLISEIKTYSDKDISYNYVEEVKPDVNEKFFQGTKNFEGYIDDLYRLTIKGDKIKIIAPQDGNDNIVFEGSIKNGEILEPNGYASEFIYIKPLLYYKQRDEKWFVFYEYN